MDAKEGILHEIAYIERGYDVRVLFACESGSRAWGFASENSDYDIRFVYVRPISEYLLLEEPKDVIQWRISAENSGMDNDFDSSGWDLRKFLRLLRDSNPSAVEWLCSEDVYYEDSRFWRARKLLDSCFDNIACAYHYYGMAKKNDFRHLKHDLVPVKGYLYAIRDAMAARYALLHLEPVPIAFRELMNTVLPRDFHPVVEELLEMKQNGDGKRLTTHKKELDDWIVTEIEAVPEMASIMRRRKRPEWDDFDAVFRALASMS